MVTKKTAKKPTKKPAAKKAQKRPTKPTPVTVSLSVRIGRETFKLASTAELTHTILDAVTYGLTASPQILETLQEFMTKRDRKRLASTLKAWHKANPRPVDPPTTVDDGPIANGDAVAAENEANNVDEGFDPNAVIIENLKTVAAEGSIRGHVARRRLRELGEGAYVDSLGFTQAPAEPVDDLSEMS